MSVKINVELSLDSINRARKKLELIKTKMLAEIFEQVVEEIKNEANRILESADIGADVKRWIKNSWDVEKVSNTHIKLINKSWKAVYVEFGVGIIGQNQRHPNADDTGYEYNVDSDDKLAQGWWYFKVNRLSELDLPENAVTKDHTSDDLSFYTQGSKGVWYLYNAVENFKMNNKEQEIFDRVYSKYLNQLGGT